MTQENEYKVPTAAMMIETFTNSVSQKSGPTAPKTSDLYEWGQMTNPNIQTGRGPARTHFVRGIPVLAH